MRSNGVYLLLLPLLFGHFFWAISFGPFFFLVMRMVAVCGLMAWPILGAAEDIRVLQVTYRIFIL